MCSGVSWIVNSELWTKTVSNGISCLFQEFKEINKILILILKNNKIYVLNFFNLKFLNQKGGLSTCMKPNTTRHM